MFKYTTPILTFEFPYLDNNCSEVFITFTQAKKIVLDMDKNKISFGDGTCSVELTQEQTGMFTGGIPIVAQIRVLLVNGTATASNIISIPIESVLKSGVIGDG